MKNWKSVNTLHSSIREKNKLKIWQYSHRQCLILLFLCLFLLLLGVSSPSFRKKIVQKSHLPEANEDEPKNIGTAPVAVGLHMSYDMFRWAFLTLKPMSLHEMCNLMAKISSYLQRPTSILNIRLFDNFL